LHFLQRTRKASRYSWYRLHENMQTLRRDRDAIKKRRNSFHI